MTHAFDLTEDQRLVQKTVREFVDRDVMPVASDMEHRDEYPDALVETMKDASRLGVEGRYRKLEPAMRAAFDLPAMTRIAIGPAWTTLPPAKSTP